MAELGIDRYQKMVDDWINTVGVRYFSELTNLAQLVEEVGEVARIISRTFGDQSFKPTDPGAAAASRTSGLAPLQQEALADELADVMFVIACIANQTGIRLTEALVKNLDKKSQRDADRHRNNPKLQG